MDDDSRTADGKKNNYPSGKSGRSYTHTDLDKLFDYWLNI